jgi:MSHA biogenesis protein MshK
MAEFMTIFKRAMSAAGFAGCLLLAASAASAQTMTDPTRPPDALNPGLAGGAQYAITGPVLQSVLISPGRRVAIINGQEVRLNGKFGNARVTRITETEVVLREGRNIQILKLFPAIDMQKAKPRQAHENG